MEEGKRSMKCVSSVHKNTAQCTICDKKMPSNVYKKKNNPHTLKVNMTLNTNKKMPKHPSVLHHPLSDKKTLQESFQRDKVYPGTGSTVIDYYLCKGSGDGNVFSCLSVYPKFLNIITISL